MGSIIPAGSIPNAAVTIGALEKGDIVTTRHQSNEEDVYQSMRVDWTVSKVKPANWFLLSQVHVTLTREPLMAAPALQLPETIKISARSKTQISACELPIGEPLSPESALYGDGQHWIEGARVLATERAAAHVADAAEVDEHPLVKYWGKR